MTLTPSNLVFLIQLVEIEIERLGAIVNDDGAPETLRDECADSLVLASTTAGNLQDAYESMWQEGCNLTPYGQLIEQSLQREK
jgi:hypothetical protein